MNDADSMRRLAARLAARLKANEYPVPQGALLQALSSLLGFTNWEVFLSKARTQPSSVLQVPRDPEYFKTTLYKIREALRPIPPVGRRYEKEYSDSHTNALLGIEDLIAGISSLESAGFTSVNTQAYTEAMDTFRSAISFLELLRDGSFDDSDWPDVDACIEEANAFLENAPISAIRTEEDWRAENGLKPQAQQAVSEDLKYSQAAWVQEVSAGRTLLGYSDWTAQQTKPAVSKEATSANRSFEGLARRATSMVDMELIQELSEEKATTSPSCVVETSNDDDDREEIAHGDYRYYAPKVSDLPWCCICNTRHAFGTACPTEKATAKPILCGATETLAEPVAWTTPFQWKSRQSERVLKLTRKAQPEYGFTVPLYAGSPPKAQGMSEALASPTLGVQDEQAMSLVGHTVWVTNFEHEKGNAVSVFLSRKSAERRKTELATEFWSEEIPHEPMPPADEIGDAYFRRLSEEGREYFTIDEAIIEA